MKTSSELCVLFDTNVLVYAANSSAPQHAAAKAAREDVLRGRIIGCVTPQVLFEYCGTVTNAKRVAAPVSPDAAFAAVRKLATVFRILSPGPDIAVRTIALAETIKAKGHEIFDVAIAATVLEHGVSDIMTFDQGVFSRIPDIVIHTPTDPAA